MSRRIIFVDDEAAVLGGLRRQLRDRRGDWDMDFAAGGADCLRLLEAAPADVVVSDMRMPGMDGAALFEEVRRRWPATVRILLTGYTDREQSLRSIRCAHQFLNKPCDAQRLRRALEEALELTAYIPDAALRSELAKMVVLPLQDSLQSRIREEMERPDASLRRLGDWVEMDPGLSAKVLQLVNSAAMGLPQRVLRPSHAVALLGLDQVRALWLALAAHRRVAPTDSRRGEEAFGHGQAVGLEAARILAPLGEEASILGFSAGLMHDIGALALQTCRPEAWARSSGRGLPAEAAACGADHAQVGAFLLGLWGLPHEVVQAVAAHHDAPDPQHPLQQALAQAESRQMLPSAVEAAIAP
jgi:HD-like signal output (HDOD) protein